MDKGLGDHPKLYLNNKIYLLGNFRSLQDLTEYRTAQEEYRGMQWHKDPIQKLGSRKRVRKAKRNVQSSIAQEGIHVEVRPDPTAFVF